MVNELLTKVQEQTEEKNSHFNKDARQLDVPLQNEIKLLHSIN